MYNFNDVSYTCLHLLLSSANANAILKQFKAASKGDRATSQFVSK